MVNTDEIRARMALLGITQKDLAKTIGISEKTMSFKMRSGKFGLEEAKILIQVLDIKNPSEIFFA